MTVQSRIETASTSQMGNFKCHCTKFLSTLRQNLVLPGPQSQQSQFAKFVPCLQREDIDKPAYSGNITRAIDGRMMQRVRGSVPHLSRLFRRLFQTQMEFDVSESASRLQEDAIRIFWGGRTRREHPPPLTMRSIGPRSTTAVTVCTCE
jgi:hypothetical protein